jgi:type IV pilus assembly protein PilN
MVSIGIYYYNSTLVKKIEDFNAKIAFAQKEINRFKKITREIAKIKKELDILRKKIAVINDLEINRKEPIKVLDAMTQLVVAKRMWFTNFSFKGETVRTNGIALDEKTVADFMTRVQESELFSSVKLLNLRKQVMNRVNMKRFEISSKKTPLKVPVKGEGKK